MAVMTRKRFAPLMAACGLCGSAVAADLDLTLHLGDTYTDNALLQPGGGPSDNIGGAALKLDLNAEGERYEANVRSAVTYLHYFNGTLDDEVLRGFEGDVRLTISPQHASWIFQENYGPVLEDPLAPDRPDNWTYDSYFTTGPDLQFGDEEDFHVLVSGRYSRADYEIDTVPSNQQYVGLLALALPGSARHERSLQVTAKRVEQNSIDVPGGTLPADGYDVQEAYLRWATEMQRGGFFIDVGATQVHDEGDTNTSPLARVGIDRVLSRTLTLTVGAGTQYSDDLRRFARLQGDAPDVEQPRDDVTRTDGPMQEEFADVTLGFNATRTTGALRLAYNRLEEDDSASALGKQEYRNATLELARQVSPRLDLALGGSFDRRTFGEIGRQDDDLYGYLSAGWRAARDFQVRLTGRYQKRNSNDVGQDFTVRSVQLEFVYQAYAQKQARRPQKFLNRDLR
jgi:Putative beta-barrel porin 2